MLLAPGLTAGMEQAVRLGKPNEVGGTGWLASVQVRLRG